MSDNNLKEQLKQLVSIQKLDNEIYDLKSQLKEKPVLVEALKDAFEAKKIKLKQFEEKAKEVQVKRKEFELDLQSQEDAIAKSNAQLSQLKTNKEYSAKISEIANMNADKSRSEESILLSLDESDRINEDIAIEKKNVSDQEKIFLDKKKEVEAAVKVMEDRVKVLESQKIQLLPSVKKEYLSVYERVLINKGGLAIVPLTGNTCGGCYMNVPNQTINEIKMVEHMVTCEMCARILYIEEDL